MEKEESLWQGGLWEQEAPVYPKIPEVVIPPPLVAEVAPKGKKKGNRSLSLGAKVGFAGFFSLILSLMFLVVTISERQENGFGGMFSDLFPFDDFYDWFQEETGEHGTIIIETMVKPSVRAASYNEDVVMDFAQGDFESLTSQEIYEKCLSSVVFIEAENLRKYATGTGVIFSEEGYIVTNAHVIEGASKVLVTLWNHQRYEATMVGYDFDQDLAILKIEAEDLVPAEFGDSSLLRVGDVSYALGNPLGADYRYTFTNGMISSVDRMLSVESSSVIFVGTTAPINSGNSGGALINEFGQVVGITTIKIESEDNTVEGMGFAIPSLRVQQVVNRLMVGEEIVSPTIGIVVYSVIEPVIGLKIQSVDRNSLVYEAGMEDGDIILEANGRAVHSVNDLNSVKGYLFQGDEIEYLLYREGELFTVTAELRVFEGAVVTSVPEDSEDEESEDEESEDDKSEDDKSEDEESEDDKSEDDKSEDGKSEDDKSEDDKSEDDESEDDKSEDDKSEDDKSEDDKSEDDKSEDDKSEDDESEDDKSEDDKSGDRKSKDNKSEDE